LVGWAEGAGPAAMPQSALHQYKAPLTGGEKHISGMEVFRQHQFHKVRRRNSIGMPTAGSLRARPVFRRPLPPPPANGFELEDGKGPVTVPLHLRAGGAATQIDDQKHEVR